MATPPDEFENIERQRLRNRYVNIAWTIFIFSPAFLLWLFWLPAVIGRAKAVLDFIVDLFK